jgi:TRAP-type C4-dicarboxylate transport system substrate-binding protein
MSFRPLATLAAMLLCLSAGAGAETFKIATIAPDGTTWMKELRQGADEVKRRSDGRVEFRFYPGGVMGNDQSVLRKVRIGQLHGGALSGGGLAAIHKDAAIYGLPFLFRSFAEVDHVRERMDPVLLAAVEAAGFVAFGLSDGGFAYLMSDDPVRGTAELNRQKVWIPDGDEVSRAGLQAVGVTPISLPLTDVLTGLETGLIDTVAASPIGAIALQWHTRIGYVTDFPLSYLFGTLVVDGKRFARLSAADQQLTREVMGRAMQRLNAANRQDDAAAIGALRQAGVEFVKPSAEEEAGWVRSAEPAVAKLGSRGLFDPAVLERVERLLADYRNGSR